MDSLMSQSFMTRNLVSMNDIMKRGNEMELFAREAYEIETFNKVNQVGFIELKEWV